MFNDTGGFSCKERASLYLALKKALAPVNLTNSVLYFVFYMFSCVCVIGLIFLDKFSDVLSLILFNSLPSAL